LKRILFYSDYFGKPTTTFISNQVVALSESGEYEILYLCLENHNSVPIKNFRLVEVPFSRNKILNRVLWELEIREFLINHKSSVFSDALIHQLQNFKPDIVHLHFGSEAIKFLQNAPRNLLPCTVIIHFHGHDASFHLNNLAYKRFYNNILVKIPSLKLVFCCEFLKINFFRQVNCYTNSVVLHYGLLDKFMVKPTDELRNSNKVKFLQVGHLERRKGQIETITAFAKLLAINSDYKKQLYLVIAGGGPDFPILQKMVKDLRICENVELTNWVTHEQVRELLTESDYFLHPSITVDSWTEGLPNAIIEALGAGIPCIATKHAGIPEIIENGVNGILVEEKNIAQLTDAMMTILSWPRRLKINSIKAQEKFSIQKNLSELATIYTSE
jgi:glycosyltransferase involved in cell wall biosynthesis